MKPVARVVTAIAITLTLVAIFWWLSTREANDVSERFDDVQTSESSPEEAPDDAAKTIDGALSLTAPPPEPEKSNPFGTGPGSITIWVSEASSDRVADAVVRITRSGSDVKTIRGSELFHRESRSSTVDPCKFAELPLGDYAIMASAGERSAHAHVRLNLRNPAHEATLVLADSVAIGGFVRDESGAPIAGAVVVPAQGEDNAAFLSPLQASALRAKSDDRGAFLLIHLHSESWKLLVTADGFAPLYSDWLAPGTKDAVLVLRRGATMRGLVALLDTGLPPAAGLLVVLRGALPFERFEARCDEAGRFQFAELHDSTYRWKVEDARLVLAEEVPRLVVKDGKSGGEQRLVVAEGGIARGRVIDAATKKGIAGVELHVATYQWSTEGPIAEGETDDSGAYRIGPLPPGSWAIRRSQTPGYAAPQWNEALLFDSRLGVEMGDLDFELVRGIAIRGRIEDAEGLPVPAAHVQATVENRNKWQQSVAGNDGGFEILGFDPQDRVSMNVIKPGYAMLPAAVLTVPPEGISGHVVTLAPEASISGRVVDGRGSPLAGVIVQVQRENEWRFGAQPVTTDRDGSFRIGSLGAGTYNLNAQRKDHWNWGPSEHGKRIELNAEEELTGLELVMAEDTGSAIRGSVISEEGVPVDGANVNCWGNSMGGGGATTDVDGGFELSGLRDGNYTVQVIHRDYAPQNRDNIATGTHDLEFKLRQAGFITGTVLDAGTSKPIPDFQIGQFPGEVTTLQPWQLQQLMRYRDPGGRFRLRSAAEGVVTIVARARGFVDTYFVARDRDAGALAADENRDDVTLLMERGGAVEGIVVGREGDPIAGALIFAGPVPHEWGRTEASVARSDEEGRFAISSIGKGVKEISAFHASFAPASVPLSGAGAGELRIVLSAGAALHGSVTVDGPPRAGCWVNVSSAAGGGNSGGTTDANGHFRLEGLPAGTATVSVGYQSEGTGWRNRALQAELVAGETKVLDISFTTGTATLEGQVFGQDLVFANMGIALNVETDEGNENYHGQLDATGSFRFEGVGAGKGAILVMSGGEKSGMRQQGAPVELVAGQVVRKEIHLSGGATIRGHVTGTDGSSQVFAAALRGAVEIPALTAELFVSLQTKVAAVMQIGEDGEYLLQGLEAGTYTLVVVVLGAGTDGPGDLEDARFTTAVVELDAEGEKTVDLEVPPRR